MAVQVDYRNLVQFRPRHWQKQYQWHKMEVEATVLRLRYPDAIDVNYVYDHRTNLMRYIMRPSHRNAVVQQHDGQTTTIHRLQELYNNECIKQALAQLDADAVVVVFCHFAFDFETLELSIDKNATSHNGNAQDSSRYGDVILTAFISMDEDEELDSGVQIKFLLTMPRRVWVVGNFKRTPFYQLKSQLMCFQQFGAF